MDASTLFGNCGLVMTLNFDLVTLTFDLVLLITAKPLTTHPNQFKLSSLDALLRDNHSKSGFCLY